MNWLNMPLLFVGFPNKAHDLKDVYSILRKIGSKATVHNHRRIGHTTTGAEAVAGARKARPFRVE